MFFNDDELGSYKTKGNKPPKQTVSRQALLRLTYPIEDRHPLSPQEFYELAAGPIAFDVESYRNYFLVAFKHIATGAYCYAEFWPGQQLDGYWLGMIMQRFEVIGFNSNNYDLAMVKYALDGAPCSSLKTLSDEIIKSHKRINMDGHSWNHIDLIEVAPLPNTSLKTYAGRLHCKRLQELPINPDTELTWAQCCEIRDYCFNDVDNTADLYTKLIPELKLRVELSEMYGLDLRSKSDAQLAEAVIVSELTKINGGKRPRRPTISTDTTFKYNIPDYISYKHPALQAMLERVRNATFHLDAGGSPIMPPELANLEIEIGGSKYKMGIGGLHSRESSVAHIATLDLLLIDRDVESYYPRTILNQRLFPQHLGEAFLEVYESIVTRRLNAKALAQDGDSVAKTIADTLKIVINGSFGKLGSAYSVLYAPDLMIQVTVTGQLALLMLIDMMHQAGVPVVSANTDGIVMACPAERYGALNAVIAQWEAITAYKTEETRYSAVYSRDVNNYFAVKMPKPGKNVGEIKVKGTYSERGSALNSVLSKSPDGYICSMAIQELLLYGTPVEDTIKYCSDMSRFVYIRNARGGAQKDGYYLGKVVRWYYAQGIEGAIYNVDTGDTVSRSQGGKPLMQMDGLCADIDYDRYIAETYESLYDIGYYRKEGVEKAPDIFA